ncbi:hypothetical protein B0H13DRAFT_2527189, partial [Mycena leptocephala]
QTKSGIYRQAADHDLDGGPLFVTYLLLSIPSQHFAERLILCHTTANNDVTPIIVVQHGKRVVRACCPPLVCSNFRALIRHHYKPLVLNKPDHPVAPAVHRFLVVKKPTSADFDDTFTRCVGGDPPTFPFPSVCSYYSWGSSGHLVQDIEVPFLAINASDDLVVHYIPFD